MKTILCAAMLLLASCGVSTGTLESACLPKHCQDNDDCPDNMECAGEAGCSERWECVPMRKCKYEAAYFCGCNGKTIQMSPNCPMVKYDYAGKCQ